MRALVPLLVLAVTAASANAAGCSSFPCLQGATCNDKEDGSFSCSCPAGFTGDGVKTPCIDINECAQVPAVCVPGSKCVNMAGSYLCSCPKGQIANEFTGQCEDATTTITGTVLASRNKTQAFPNTIVSLYAMVKSTKSSMIGQTTTDSKGVYQFSVAFGNRYMTCASPTGYEACVVHTLPSKSTFESMEVEAGKEAEKAAKEAAKAAEKAAKDAAKAAEKARKDAEEAAKQADKEAEEAAKKTQKEAEEAAKKAEKEAEEAAKKAEEASKKAEKDAEKGKDRKRRLTLLSSLNIPVPSFLAAFEWEIHTIWTMDSTTYSCDYDSIVASSINNGCMAAMKGPNYGLCYDGTRSVFNMMDSNCQLDTFGFESVLISEPGYRTYSHMVYGFQTTSSFASSASAQAQVNVYRRGPLGFPVLAYSLNLQNAIQGSFHNRFWHTFALTINTPASSLQGTGSFLERNIVSCKPYETTGSNAILPFENGGRGCNL